MSQSGDPDAAFQAANAFTIKEEGPYTTSSEDSGNWSTGRCGSGVLIGSNLGVGAPAAIAWMGDNATAPKTVTAAWMKAIPTDIQQALARANYWNATGGPTLPAGVGLSVYDFGYNTGPATSVRTLQTVLGVTVDGGTDPETTKAAATPVIAAIVKHLASADVVKLQQMVGAKADGIAGPVTQAAVAANAVALSTALLIGLYNAQVTYYRGLSNFATYGTGWVSRSTRRLSAALSTLNQGPTS